MSVRQSTNNRSDGNSWHGNELGGCYCGSMPRNRNSSYEDSTNRSNMPGSNSNSEEPRDTSPEPRWRDNNREAANSQASDGQQTMDHGNTECDGPEDPRDSKRKLNQAVTEFLGSSRSSKRFKSNLECVFFLGFFTSIVTSSLIAQPQILVDYITGHAAFFDSLAHLYPYGRFLTRDLNWTPQWQLPPTPPLCK